MDPQSRIGTAGLNGSGAGWRIVERIRAVEMSSVIADIVRFNHGVGCDLLLNAEVPMLVTSAREVSVGGIHAGVDAGASEGPAQKEVSEGAVRNGIRGSENRFTQQERRHVAVHPAIGVFHFVKDAVPAAKHGLVAEGSPG